ncbi:NADH-ubiquinone oxidoreductase 21 kDa subunit [Pseudohyphozyma bogoriensis]|nr:NADH-ubiquinone oxidoreductase 21 kDa subunit [Pseudohyphozyma bogoriensis]
MSLLRASRIVRKKVTADPFATHVGDRSPFWKAVREKLAVNPEINTGNPLVVEHRWPQPGSRPEKFTVPASRASDVAQNPYWQRDFRRNYPQTAYVTQPELAELLLLQGGFTALPAPSSEATSSTALTADSPKPSLSSIYSSSSVPATKGFKPPVPPTLKLKWSPSVGKDAIPHNPDSYFPMVAYNAAKL